MKQANFSIGATQLHVFQLFTGETILAIKPWGKKEGIILGLIEL